MKALYRKYRPTSLDSVIGQDQVVEPLRESLKRDKISHAYLFCGPRGTGKTSIARIFAHEINKFKYELEDSFIDIIEIDAASNTGVDNIRDLREKAIIAPSEGKYKVYIIDEIHMLSKSAFNALLKIIEEPPVHVVFIMATTDPQKVPITITSRTQIYTFQLADHATMHSHLSNIAEQEKIDITSDALDIIVHRGGGSFRDSLTLLDQISTLTSGQITTELVESALGLPADTKIKTLLQLYSDGNIDGSVDILRELLNSGTTAESLAANLIENIVNNPTPSTLQLVDKLFGVQDPFAEAKLLVAFLSSMKSAATPPTPVFAQRTITSPKPTPASTPKPIPTNTPKSTPTSAPEPAPVAQQEVTSAPNPAPSNSSLTLDSLLSVIGENNSAVRAILEKSKIEITSSSIEIYPSSRSHQKILKSDNNVKLLNSVADGLRVNIHEFGEETKSNPSINPQISAIMGNVEEVTEDDDSPF